jgi:hypothetical protein
VTVCGLKPKLPHLSARDECRAPKIVDPTGAPAAAAYDWRDSPQTATVRRNSSLA